MNLWYLYKNIKNNTREYIKVDSSLYKYLVCKNYEYNFRNFETLNIFQFTMAKKKYNLTY